ncbi:hypothetical protein V1522DRAFT_391790 [Lipomyces starkeyi]
MDLVTRVVDSIPATRETCILPLLCHLIRRALIRSFISAAAQPEIYRHIAGKNMSTHLLAVDDRLGPQTNAGSPSFFAVCGLDHAKFSELWALFTRNTINEINIRAAYESVSTVWHPSTVPWVVNRALTRDETDYGAIIIIFNEVTVDFLEFAAQLTKAAQNNDEINFGIRAPQQREVPVMLLHWASRRGSHYTVHKLCSPNRDDGSATGSLVRSRLSDHEAT